MKKTRYKYLKSNKNSIKIECKKYLGRTLHGRRLSGCCLF